MSGFGGGSKNKSTEQALKSTIELDRFIDKLLAADSSELPQQIAESILSFDRNFWLRVATRFETGSTDDKKDLEELANQVMFLVDKIVKKTQEKIEVSTDELSTLLTEMADEDSGEILWPPTNPKKIANLRQAISEKERDGRLDETFLSAVSAQLRQAIEREDRPGLIALLRKLLQLYAASWLGRKSFATKSDGSTDASEKLLEDVMTSEEEDWQPLIYRNLSFSGGQVTDTELLTAVSKRMERLLMRTEGGSYQQRIIGEYLIEIESRIRSIVEAFKASPSPIQEEL